MNSVFEKMEERERGISCSAVASLLESEVNHRKPKME
jgi:hypothetical protein